jgi:uncharacterized membrane protein
MEISCVKWESALAKKKKKRMASYQKYIYRSASLLICIVDSMHSDQEHNRNSGTQTVETISKQKKAGDEKKSNK